MRVFQQSMALLLSWCLVLVGARDGFAYQTDASISQSPPTGRATEPRTIAATRGAHRTVP